MSEPSKSKLVSAKQLKRGDLIQFHEQQTYIRGVEITDSWVILYFTNPIWNPFLEKLEYQFGCHPGFCITKV